VRSPYKVGASSIPSGSYLKPSTSIFPRGQSPQRYRPAQPVTPRRTGYANIITGTPPVGKPPKFRSKYLIETFKTKRKVGKSITRYQPSFTGLSLGIRGKGIFPGGLSVRGII